jgi:hypothetical protein
MITRARLSHWNYPAHKVVPAATLVEKQQITSEGWSLDYSSLNGPTLHMR